MNDTAEDDAMNNVLNSREIETDKEAFKVDFLRMPKNNRSDGMIGIYFLDGKMKTFYPEDIEIDEENHTVTMSNEMAIKRGFA